MMIQTQQVFSYGFTSRWCKLWSSIVRTWIGVNGHNELFQIEKTQDGSSFPISGDHHLHRTPRWEAKQLWRINVVWSRILCSWLDINIRRMWKGFIALLFICWNMLETKLKNSLVKWMLRSGTSQSPTVKITSDKESPVHSPPEQIIVFWSGRK